MCAHTRMNVKGEAWRKAGSPILLLYAQGQELLISTRDNVPHNSDNPLLCPIAPQISAQRARARKKEETYNLETADKTLIIG